MHKIRLISIGVATAAILALVGTGIASASIPSANGTFYGCVKGPNATYPGMLVVKDDHGTGTISCGAGATEIQWNQTGPQGPAGPAGPQGPAGTPGTVLDTGVLTVTGTESNGFITDQCALSDQTGPNASSITVSPVSVADTGTNFPFSGCLLSGMAPGEDQTIVATPLDIYGSEVQQVPLVVSGDSNAPLVQGFDTSGNPCQPCVDGVTGVPSWASSGYTVPAGDDLLYNFEVGADQQATAEYDFQMVASS
jgi:hypothetical protein